MSTVKGILATVAVLGSLGAMAQPRVNAEPPRQKEAIVAPASPNQAQPDTEALRQLLNLPPGSKIELDITHKDGGQLKTRQEGTGKGASAIAEGDKLSDKITGTAPIANVGADGSAGAEGGSIEREAAGSAVKVPPMPWANPLFWIGVGMLGVAGFGVYSGLRRLALIAGVGGVGLIAAAFYPVILLFAVAAVVAAVFGPYVYTEIKKRKAENDAKEKEKEGDKYYEALRATVGGVEHSKLPGEMKKTIAAMLPAGTTLDLDKLVMLLQRNVKDAIAKEADGTDKEVIDEVKREDRVGKYAD